MSRRKGRILAFQALYSYDVGGEPLDELLKLEWSASAPENVSGTEENSEEPAEAPAEEQQDELKAGDLAETQDFARILIAGSINHLDEIDSQIKSHLSGKWDFDRLNKVSLAILRLSVFSLLYQKDTHPTIVIDEAIAIAKQFGTDESFKFINAVLDNIRKEITN